MTLSRGYNPPMNLQSLNLQFLNPEQSHAVTLPDEPALILAGAGSGKTRVLTTRIAWLIQQGRVTPSGILAVTFTNKAAKEMLTRLTAMLPMNWRGMWIGTFHGLCHRFLRAHYRDANLPQTFQILDSADQLSVIKRLLKKNNVDEAKYPPRNLQQFINSCKEEGLRAGVVPLNDPYTRRCVELYGDYETQCQREGVVDFAELLLRTYEVLSVNEPLRAHYQARFRHVLVDEFQDTNNLQYRWLKLFGQQAAVFAVGDDDQSIYAFRGANAGNMTTFEREFRVQHLIKLEQNYRSTSHILDAANALIAHNAHRLGKNLRTDRGHGEPVRVYEALSDLQEAQWLVEEIQSLLQGGTARSEIAVLYRSNAQSRVVESGLFKAGIPYRVYGGLRFFERAEIKHALAYCRLIENSDDDTALMRVINFPARGIGARSLEQLTEFARAQQTSLYAAIPHVSGKSGASLLAFTRLMESLRSDTRGLSLPDIIKHVIQASGLKAHYQLEKEGQDRLDNLDELVNAAAFFIQDDDDIEKIGSPLANFLAHASLEAGDNQADPGQEAVQLMTVHAAKGLEFRAVFMTGLEEGLFPHENAMNDLGGLEEERRLMYVAITRARERLYLSYAQTRMLHGQTRYNLRSRFFDELPDAHLLRLNSITRSHTSNSTNNQGLPFWAQRQTTHDSGLRAGQNVRHAKFGDGVVVKLEGHGADTRAEIHFGSVGTKWLALSVAKLDPI